MINPYPKQKKNTVSAPAERERQYFMSLLIDNTTTDKNPPTRTTTQLTRSNSREFRSFFNRLET